MEAGSASERALVDQFSNIIKYNYVYWPLVLVSFLRNDGCICVCRSEFKTCYTDSDNMVNYDLLHGDYEWDGGPDIVASVHYDSQYTASMCERITAWIKIKMHWYVFAWVCWLCDSQYTEALLNWYICWMTIFVPSLPPPPVGRLMSSLLHCCRPVS